MSLSTLARAVLSAVLLLASLQVAACADTEPPVTSGVDADGDGYDDRVDCDDDDPLVHPDAKERENCLDDNCDGQADEGTPNHDRDRDRFCPSTGDVGDCEGNPDRHPLQSEDFGGPTGQPNGIDDNCNGLVDDGLPGSDMDKDGFTLAQGDCNDRDPAINPGAIEVVGKACRNKGDCPSGKCFGGYCRCSEDDDCSSLEACIDDKQCTQPGETCVDKRCRSSWRCLEAQKGLSDPTLKVCRDNADNDCDTKTDEVSAGCDALASLDERDPLDHARAMELCDADSSCSVSGSCPGNLLCAAGRCRRVLSARFGSVGSPKGRAIVGVFAEEGLIKPRKHDAMVVLSSGLARYNPKLVCPQEGTDLGIQGKDPDPSVSDTVANDLTMLELRILVPTNARSFSFDFQFFTAEYPEFLGTEFNDTFWAHLDSRKYKGNISFDKAGTPIRLNNAFFDICDPDPGHPQTQQYCTKPAALLTGTGFAKDCASTLSCGGVSCGGSTGWLTTTAPVEPGEIITLSFYIFDKGDHIHDSTVLLDNFRWSLTPALVPITAPD